MVYQVKRLTSNDQSRRYHLINSQGKVVLVADYGSSWVSSSQNHQVRLARIDGSVVALIDLSTTAKSALVSRVNYPLLFNHAVYAIFHEYRQSRTGVELKRPYYSIEVETAHWLLIEDVTQPALCYTIHGKTPSGLGTFLDPQEATLPAPAGTIMLSEDETEFSVTLPRNHLRRADLISLTLAFLIDLPYRVKQIST